MKAPSKTKSFGSVILERLTDFSDAQDRGASIEKQFKCTAIKIPVRRSKISPNDVKSIRGLLELSQVNFANLLGVSGKTVQAWEQGLARPSGMASRFLDEIRHDPAYWRRRSKQLAANPTA